MEISIAQNVAGQIQELLQISCIFFANWFALFLHFLHFNFSYKNGFAFVLHFFASRFLGVHFSMAFFFLHFFSKYLFTVFQKEAQPDLTTIVSYGSTVTQDDIKGIKGLSWRPQRREPREYSRNTLGTCLHGSLPTMFLRLLQYS